MPQFDFANVFWPQLFWLAVFFAILYFGIVKTTLPRLSKVVTEREDSIATDLSTAKNAKEKADQVSEEYQAELSRSRDEARGVVAAAKDEAAKAAEKRLVSADKRVAKKLAEAEERIDQACIEASASLREIAAESAEAIVSKLTGKAPARDEALAEVDAAMGKAS